MPGEQHSRLRAFAVSVFACGLPCVPSGAGRRDYFALLLRKLRLKPQTVSIFVAIATSTRPTWRNGASWFPKGSKWHLKCSKMLFWPFRSVLSDSEHTLTAKLIAGSVSITTALSWCQNCVNPPSGSGERALRCKATFLQYRAAKVRASLAAARTV